MIDPCAPHSAATIRAWRIWGRAHAFWHAPKFGPCVKAGAFALPLLGGIGAVHYFRHPPAYPGMGGFPAAGATEGYAPAFGGLFGPVGAWFPQAVGFTPPTAAVSAGLGPAEVGSPLLSGPTATGGSPVTPVNTPEPGSLALLAGLLALMVALRRWV